MQISISFLASMDDGGAVVFISNAKGERPRRWTRSTLRINNTIHLSLRKLEGSPRVVSTGWFGQTSSAATSTRPQKRRGQPENEEQNQALNGEPALSGPKDHGRNAKPYCQKKLCQPHRPLKKKLPAAGLARIPDDRSL